MKPYATLIGCLLASHLYAAESPPPPGKAVSLFDGRTLANWEGDPKIWRMEDGCLTGGSLAEMVKRNEFLASTRDYTNFVIRLKIKLTGTNGFINSGFQIRSQRVPNNSEMSGYQCDFGEPNWYGAIYDESRRNKVMSPSDMTALRPVIKQQAWNDYVIRADGPRVTTWINGVMGTDYTEPDPKIPGWGKLGIQVHGGGKAVVQVKDISIEELPPTPPGAPEPKKAAQHDEANRAAAQTAGQAQPLSPEEERTRFSLAPGFEIELVAAEDMAAGFGKFVTVDWDQHGNLWTMTALEYPVDANENAAVAKELYASKARDKVLVYDRDPKSPTGYTSKPRVFAEGLAIPLGMMPFKNGVYVQHGPDIVFLKDTDGDGKADQREVILTGFGVQDSHLFPHQFTRAPGGWMWMAQGAFNYGKVRTTKGDEVQFDQTRMAKFRPNGSEFEITSQGPCNIWGLFMTMEGETWIQEANDFGYPAMPFHEYANYPGCSQAQWKSYAPEFPGTAPHFAMGGTGLSGLAVSDGWRSENSNLQSQIATWPESYCDVIYIANPITRKIQAIKARRDGPRYSLTKLPDFVLSSDEMFRPVALRLGPDGCLYIVDWYNKIISHNEVPRNHPERDKKRGRIWRVRPSDFKPLEVPDFATISGDELMARLGGPNTTQSHLAWQAIVDRRMDELGPRLERIVHDAAQPGGRRIAALWAIEGLSGSPLLRSGAQSIGFLKPLFTDANRNIRREAFRILGALAPALSYRNEEWADGFDALDRAVDDPDAEVRAEAIKAAAGWSGLLGVSWATVVEGGQRALPILLKMARPSLAGPTMRSTQNGRTIQAGDAYDREFERYLVRLFLERRPQTVAAFLKSEAARSLPVENRLLAALALEPKTGAARVAELLPALTRPPGQEELLRLAQFPDEPGVGEALKQVLQNSATSTAAMEALLKVRTKLDASKVTPLLTEATKQLLAQTNPSSLELGTKLASSFQLASVEPELVNVLKNGWGGYPKADAKEYLLRPESLAALQALRELKSDRTDLFLLLAEKGGPAEQQAAVAALGVSRDPKGPQWLAVLYPNLPAAPRHTALASLTGTKTGASALVKSIRAGKIARDELDGATLDKLTAVLGDDADLAALVQDMASFFRPALRLDGKDASYLDSKLELAGPFTVETWVKLEGDISNRDGILGAPGVLDINFAGALFRVWVGGGQHDVVLAKKKTVAGVWMHYAVTRDEQGVFRIYLNGELDATSGKGKSNTNTFAGVDIGRTIPSDAGTDGWLSEFRVWNRARTAEEIRAEFDRSYDNRGQVSAVTHRSAGEVPARAGETPALLFTGTNWGKLHGGARIVKTTDFPPLLTAEESKALAEKFGKFHALASATGDTTKGKALFTSVCMGCHSVAGLGGQIGPVLTGAGALGVDALLRNILTPNAAMEPGYRMYRVELKDGDVVDGLLVSQDKDALVLRRQNTEDLRIAQRDVQRAAFTKTSIMPEGLLDPLPPQDVSDLFAYLKTLR